MAPALRTPAFALSLMLVSAAPLVAQDLTDVPMPLLDAIEAGGVACAEQGGDFDMGVGALVQVDLDGDTEADWVLDEAYFACSTAASLYCGTGGCPVHLSVGDVAATLQAQSWEVAVTATGRHVLLATLHGVHCDGYGTTHCVGALTWDAETSGWRSATVVLE